MRTITLSDDEFYLLMLALGLASGEALKRKDHPHVMRLFRLANAVNRENPNWTPYEIPEDAHA
jgi:hypothetical protein